MTTLTVYSRVGCHLCEVMLEELLPLVRDRAKIEVVDIDTQPQLRDRFDVRVPVLALGEQEICEHQLDREALQAVLPATAQDA